MKAIVSGRSGRALIIEEGSFKSFDVDEPSNLVSRHASDLPYLFGDASDLRFLEDKTTIESVASELKADCYFTWALDLTLISLDAEVAAELRREALEGLEELLADENTLTQLQRRLYAEPLPEDNDLKGALRLCNTSETVTAFEFLEKLDSDQEWISTVKLAWEAIPISHFASDEAREQFRQIAIREGLFLEGVKSMRLGLWFLLEVAFIDGSPDLLESNPTYQQILEEWNEHLRYLAEKSPTFTNRFRHQPWLLKPNKTTKY